MKSIGKISETRNQGITGKIITSSEIRKLFLDIKLEVEKLEKETDKKIKDSIGPKPDEMTTEQYAVKIDREAGYRKGEITLEDINGAKFKSESFDIFDSDILDTKQIKFVGLYLSDHNHDLHIYIEINHSDRYYTNRIQIEGTDSVWVNGLMKKIDENIDSWKNQFVFIKKNVGISFIIMLLVINFSTFYIFEYFVSLIPLVEDENPDETIAVTVGAARLLTFFITGIFSLFFTNFMFDRVNSIWLDVELHTGKEHNMIEKERRKKIAFIILVFVVPIITSLILEFIK